MYLNPRNKYVSRDLNNLYDMHRTILRAFDSIPSGEKARKYFGILYRIDYFEYSMNISLLVQSNVEPQWSKLYKDYILSYNDKQYLKVKRIDPFYDHLFDGQICRFKFVANPTKKIKTDKKTKTTKKNSIRVPLTNDSDQIDWLLRKAEQYSFEILKLKSPHNFPSMSFVPSGTVKLKKFVRSKDSNHSQITSTSQNNNLNDTSKSSLPSSSKRKLFNISVYRVTYSGILRIINKNNFLNALKNGIGPSKSFGCGLLSIAPLKTTPPS